MERADALCGKVCERLCIHALMAVCQYINAYVLHNCSHVMQSISQCMHYVGKCVKVMHLWLFVNT